MAESKKHKKTLQEQLTLTNQLATRPTTFGEYLVRKRVGISSDEAHELQGYVDTWRERDLSEAEAWSLIISVEAWTQARKAFYVAIAIGVANVVVAIAGLLMTLFR